MRGLLTASVLVAAALVSCEPAECRRQARPASSVRSTLTSSHRSILLSGPYDTVRPMFDLSAQGVTKDVTDRAAVRVTPEGLASFENGSVRGRRNGQGILVATVRSGGATAECRIPIRVTRMKQPPLPRFTADVMPVLTKAGCNGGPCHGANAGKGGFKLSLLGYDPDSDYEAISRLSSARRIFPSDPERSLLLRKATNVTTHGGGKRFEPGSVEYALLRDWIARGAAAPDAREPAVSRLDVFPRQRALPKGGAQRLRVQAVFSDGSTQDVTSQTLFSSADASILRVSPTGTAEVVGPGEGAAVIRYRGAVATARFLTPFSRPRRVSGPPPSNPIDRFVFEKTAALGLEPSDPADDGEFLRRAFLDTIGVLPTADETRAFFADGSPSKRARLIDDLLERPEFVDFWATRWGDMLRNSRRALSNRGMAAFHAWIRKSVAENKPWDRFVREILVSAGDSYENGPANFFRVASAPEDLGETTAQLFLGVRLQCARCHNHPFEKWTQRQFYELAAFFGRVRAKTRVVVDEPDAPMVKLAGAGEIYYPRIGQPVVPGALDAPPLDAAFKGDRREKLADWMTAPDNPFFARVIANRIWRYFMGRGLVEPVDDIRVTNPPTNEALLDWLARDLRAQSFDLKHLMRRIMQSRAYQLSSRRKPGNEADNRYYSRFLVKRLTAEQLLDAVVGNTGVPEKFAGYPAGTRASELPDTLVVSYFLDTFGRPARQTTCECERTNEPTIGQALHLLNGASLNEKLASPNGRLARLAASGLPAEKVVEELYLAAFSRYPTTEESARASRRLSAASSPEARRRVAEDLLWAILNTKEFIFNR